MSDPRQQLTVFCRHMQNWTWDRIAESMGYSVSSVHRFYRDGLVALEKILQAEEARKKQAREDLARAKQAGEEKAPETDKGGKDP